MIARIQVAFLAVITAVALTFAVATRATADDKKDAKGCEVCASVKDVCKAMSHCAKCEKPNEKCDYCTKAEKENETKYACKDCKNDKTCDTCKKFLDASKGDKVEAAKKLMESKVFCCSKCEKAGEEKAASCAKCKEAREKIEKVEVAKK